MVALRRTRGIVRAAIASRPVATLPSLSRTRMTRDGHAHRRLMAAAGSPRTWLIAMTGAALIGGGLAVSQAAETDWVALPSVSHLGMHPGAGGIVNATLLTLGFSTVAFGMSLEHCLARLHATGRLSPRARGLLGIGFLLAGAAVSLTGLFRIDGGLFLIDGELSLAIHMVAGFATPTVLTATLVGARLAVGSLGRRFDGLAAIIISSLLVLVASAHHLIVLPYSVMEVICIGLIGAWLWLFEARLRHLSPTRGVDLTSEAFHRGAAADSCRNCCRTGALGQ